MITPSRAPGTFSARRAGRTPQQGPPTLTATQPDNTPVSHDLGTINSPPPLCQMGVLPPAANAFGYVLPPQDAYYTLLVPNNCPTCPDASYNLTEAHV